MFIPWLCFTKRLLTGRLGDRPCRPIAGCHRDRYSAPPSDTCPPSLAYVRHTPPGGGISSTSATHPSSGRGGWAARLCLSPPPRFSRRRLVIPTARHSDGLSQWPRGVGPRAPPPPPPPSLPLPCGALVQPSPRLHSIRLQPTLSGPVAYPFEPVVVSSPPGQIEGKIRPTRGENLDRSRVSAPHQAAGPVLQLTGPSFYSRRRRAARPPPPPWLARPESPRRPMGILGHQEALETLAASLVLRFGAAILPFRATVGKPAQSLRRRATGP